MSLPARLRSEFSSSTLRTIETHANRFLLRSPLFFRAAYTANVTENERRTFQPIVVADPSGIKSPRCTCSAVLRPGDLCQHIAVLLARLVGDDGSLPSERFEPSVWRAVAFAAFSEGRHIVMPDADSREQLLRKYVLTQQEQALLKRGAGSSRLLFESSGWYRWAKSLFLDAKTLAARITIRDGEVRLCTGEQELPLPTAAVEQLLGGAPEIVANSGFELAAQSVAPSLRIEVTNGRSLRFSPVVVGSGGVVYDRDTLPKFGRFFLIGDRFVSPAPAPPMFVEKAAREQSQLFEVRRSAGLPYDRDSVVSEDDAFAFIERHRDELAAMPADLAPEVIRSATTVRLEGDVIFDFAAPHRDLLELDITFMIPDSAGEIGTSITAAEIAKARRDGVRALIRGALWIDVSDPQFVWLDSVTLGPDGRVLLTKLELLRIRGSIRGKALFRGDPSCQQIFALYDEIAGESDAPEPASLGVDLYGYQQTGYQWLWLLQKNGFGGLLCDDMGLGKTHQAIALIRSLVHTMRERTVLIVCPTSVLDHWREKLERYLPEVPFETWRTGEAAKGGAGGSHVLTTYGIVRSRVESFRGRRFDLLVLDEAQTIKNADTATSHALRAIDKRIAVGLTGTPIENHEGELKTLLDFVVPGYLPSSVEGRHALQRLARPFVLRRTKSQVLTELPPKIVDKRYCDLTTEQQTLYRRVLQSRANPLRAQLRSGGSVSYLHIFAALNYLKQICNHPATAGGGFGDDDVSSGKWDLFIELIDECMASGLKVVVFSQYLAMLAKIEDHLFRNDIGYASIKGATRNRGDETTRFRDDPDCRVFTASLRAGGLGIDLTSASVVIHYDRWWNQAREDQATDRVHRLGQSKGVQVLKLITRGTIEEKIDTLIQRKAALSLDILQPDDPTLVKQFSKEELEELLEG
jgi:superfamily II DNA or RNA helicase